QMAFHKRNPFLAVLLFSWPEPVGTGPCYELLYLNGNVTGKSKLSFGRPGVRLAFLPVQADCPQLIPRFAQIPQLDSARAHACSEITAIRTEGQRAGVWRKRQKRLDRACVIKTSRAVVRGEPKRPCVGRVKDAVEVGQVARALPGGCTPE